MIWVADLTIQVADLTIQGHHIHLVIRSRCDKRKWIFSWPQERELFYLVPRAASLCNRIRIHHSLEKF